jgi:hypothetical protein
VNREPWTTQLGPKPDDPRKQAAWHRAAIVVTAYRDRYQITDGHYPLGSGSADNSVRQKIDMTRARTALNGVQAVKTAESFEYTT